MKNIIILVTNLLLCFTVMATEPTVTEPTPPTKTYAKFIVIEENDVDVVLLVEGEFGPNTGFEFREKVLDLKLQYPTAQLHVVLNSVGGVVDSGLTIARVIRAAKGITYVTSEFRCYSACTVAFMGGVLRSNKGALGFHNAWYEPQIPMCMVEQLVDEFVTGQAYGIKLFVTLSEFVDDDKLRKYGIFYSSIMNQSKKNSNRIITMPISACEEYGVCKTK